MTTKALATTNRLAKSEAGFTSKFTAAEYAAMAREKGLLKHAAAWDSVAEARGEERIPNGITVRFNDQKQKYRVRFGEVKPL
jgi:hypothetical protein